MDKKTRKKICLISSSGGHYEQLRCLKPLEKNHDIYFVTEKTEYSKEADYYLRQGKPLLIYRLLILFVNVFGSMFIWYKEKPDFVITTGTMVALPTIFLAKLFGKRTIYIETFARINDGTRAGKFFYGKTDLFIYQWETLESLYPNGIYGGSIY